MNTTTENNLETVLNFVSMFSGTQPSRKEQNLFKSILKAFRGVNNTSLKK